MSVYVLAIVLLLSSGAMSRLYRVPHMVSENDCLPGYTINNIGTKCYKLYTTAKLWSEAKQTCDEEFTHLAFVDSKQEAKLIGDILRKEKLVESDIDYYLKYVFVGVTKPYKDEEVWENLIGKPLKSTLKWANGEPNNAEGKENCLTLDRYGYLNDYYCDKPAVFVCVQDVVWFVKSKKHSENEDV